MSMDPMAAPPPPDGADDGADSADGGGADALAAFSAALEIACGDPELTAAAAETNTVTIEMDDDGNAVVTVGKVETPVSADLIAEHLGMEDDGDSDSIPPPPPVGA